MDIVYEVRQLLDYAVNQEEAAKAKSRIGRPEEIAAARGQIQAFHLMADRISEWLEQLLDAEAGVVELNDETAAVFHLTFATKDLGRSFALEFDTGRVLATQLPSGAFNVYEFNRTGFSEGQTTMRGDLRDQ